MESLSASDSVVDGFDDACIIIAAINRVYNLVAQHPKLSLTYQQTMPMYKSLLGRPPSLYIRINQ